VKRSFADRLSLLLLGLAVLAGAGCGTTGGPELARRPQSPQEKAWTSAVQGWMPSWTPAAQPYPVRVHEKAGSAPAAAPVVRRPRTVRQPAPAPAPVVRQPAPAPQQRQVPAPIIDDRREAQNGAPAASEGFVIAAPGTDAGANGRLHRVAKGETLAKLARKYYGDPGQWRRIHEANRETIGNPDSIRPGIVLIIP
jgi:nucleoid-associated protein YgaU